MKITKKNLATAMIDLAGQENNDDLEHDLLYEGGRYIKELEQQIDKMKNCHNCKNYTSKQCLYCKRSMSLFDTDNWEIKND